VPDHVGDSSFERWQEAQRQLHSLEREILEIAREHRSRRGPGVPDDLVQRAQELRLEVDALFPAAMQDLEDQVSRIKSRRQKLADVRPEGTGRKHTTKAAEGRRG
jgi:septation ring formation regulator EzrA